MLGNVSAALGVRRFPPIRDIGIRLVRNAEHIVIDCDVRPFVPEGLRVKEHRKGGQLELNSLRFSFALEEGILNANVLDFFFREENQHLIPENRRRKDTFFRGTAYSDLDGDNLGVRYLYWFGFSWRWAVLWS